MAILETPSGAPPKPVSAVRRLRLTSVPEAVSFLLLLVCSVLKRTTEFNAVPVMGSVHGVLFILYVLFWADAWKHTKWPRGRAALIVVLSVLPTGGFFADRMLRREEAEGVAAVHAAAHAAKAGAAGAGDAEGTKGEGSVASS